MGSIATLRLNDYNVLEMKNVVEPMALSCFQDRDLSMSRSQSTRWRIDLERTIQDQIAVYKISRFEAISRLEVLGFTLREAEKEFLRGREQFISNHSQWFEEEDPEGGLAVSRMTFRDYVDFLKELYGARASIFGSDRSPSLSTRVYEVTQIFDPNEYFYSFPSTDVRWVIRLLLDVASDSAELELDISEMVNNGLIEDPSSLCSETRQQIILEHSRAVPTLVLTEGSTDSEFLGAVLQRLYPHLVDYFSFLDFGLLKLQGGAPELVKTLKAFSTAGISNRIVAIFDNDAAALDALSSLDRKKLPPNVRVLTYPQTQRTKSYPTLGPTGDIVPMNLDGTAASIELYFGDDVLRYPNSDEFAPVRWTSYIKGQKRYQGEIEGKGDLQKRFREKLESPSAQSISALEDMRTIIDHIIKAFSDD